MPAGRSISRKRDVGARQDAGLDGDARQEGDAELVIDHLDQGGQAGRPDFFVLAIDQFGRCGADMIAQAMAIFQQQQGLAGEFVRR